MNDHAMLAVDPAANADLLLLHSQLVALVRRLDLAIDDAPDAATVRVITEQIQAANARVTAVGRTLFAHQSQQIADAAQEVGAVIPHVQDALDHLERLDELVAGMTSMLKLVDEAVVVASKAC